MEKSLISTHPKKKLILLDIVDIQVAIVDAISEPDVLARLCIVNRQTKQNILRNLFSYPSKAKVEFIELVITKWMHNPVTIDKSTKELLNLVRKNGFALKPELYTKAITLLTYNAMPSEKYQIINLLHYAKKILPDREAKIINTYLKWTHNPPEQIQYSFKPNYKHSYLKPEKLQQNTTKQNQTTYKDDNKNKKTELPTTKINIFIETTNNLLKSNATNNKYKMFRTLGALALKIQEHTSIESLKQSLTILEKVFLHAKNSYLEISILKKTGISNDQKILIAFYTDTIKAILKLIKNFPLEENSQRYFAFIDEILTIPPPEDNFYFSSKILKIIFKLCENIDIKIEVEKYTNWCTKLLVKFNQNNYSTTELNFFIKKISIILNHLITNYQHEEYIDLYSIYVDNFLSIAFDKKNSFPTKNLFKIILETIAQFTSIIKRDKQQKFVEKYFNAILKIANHREPHLIPYDNLAKTMLSLWKIDNSHSIFIWNYFTSRQLTIKYSTVLIMLDELATKLIDINKKNNPLELEVVEESVSHENLSLVVNQKIQNQIASYLNPDFILWVNLRDSPLLDALHTLTISNVSIIDYKILYPLAEKIKIKYPNIASSLICTANLLTLNKNRLEKTLQESHVLNGNQWRYVDGKQFNGYINLRGFDFSGLRLLNIDFTNTDLSKANFSNTNCTNLVFHYSNLYESNFVGARINNTDFEHCSNLASAKRITLNNLKIKILKTTTFEELDTITMENRRGILSIHLDRLSSLFGKRTNSENEFNTEIIQKRKQLDEQANEQSNSLASKKFSAY